MRWPPRARRRPGRALRRQAQGGGGRSPRAGPPGHRGAHRRHRRCGRAGAGGADRVRAGRHRHPGQQRLEPDDRPWLPAPGGTTDEVFWGDLDVKVLGYIRVARAVAPLLVEQGWGRIINVSGSGYRQTLSIVRTIRNVSVVALTKNLADELGPHGVNVTVVHPAGTADRRERGPFHRPRPRQRDRPVRDRRRGGRRRRVPGFPAERRASTATRSTSAAECWAR